MKKIIYISGILTVAGLLLIIKFDTLPHLWPAKNETSLKFFLPAEDGSQFFSGYRLMDEIKRKRIVAINLSGNIMEDDKKMIFIQTASRQLQYSHDTSMVIKIQLSDNLSYGRFVELSNMMLKDKHKRYALWQHCFYVLGDLDPAPDRMDSSRQAQALSL